MKIKYRRERNIGYEYIVYEVLHVTNTFSFDHNINRFGVPIGDSPNVTYFLVASEDGSFFWIPSYDCKLVGE